MSKEEQWRLAFKRELGGNKPASKQHADIEQLDLKPLYSKDDLAGIDHLGSFPGEFPFVRGPYASMYLGRPWTIRQYAGFSTAEQTNAFFRRNLAQGQKGLSVAFDLATHRGYDSDDKRARDDVGKAGVSICSVEDMKRLFDGIPLDKMSVSMTMNGAVIPIMANFIVAAEEQGVSKDQLTGTIQNDILKEFMVRNTYIYPPEESMRICSNIISYTSKHMPKFNAISISGYHIQEAGATAVQELAFTIADGLEYVRAGLLAGPKIDEFAGRLSFFFGIGMNFFVEIAKLRAARVLWAKYMQELFAPNDKRSLMLRTHCQTSGVSLTAQDPYNNVIRTTLEALSAVLGGTQSLHTNALDEAVALPTDFSARIARNTQLIMQLESGVCDVIDPLAGSYFIEKLTNDLVVSAQDLIGKIEEMGGMTKAVTNGYPKVEIERSAALRQAAIDSGRQPVVGVNKFPAGEDAALEILRIDNAKVLAQQTAGLKKLRSGRDASKVTETLNALTKAAGEPKGLKILDRAIDAARARATVGEISDAIAKVFTRYEQSPPIVTGVYDAAYGNDKAYLGIKKKIAGFAQEHARKPKILVVKLGQDGHDRGSRVIAGAFTDLGFEVEVGPLFQTPDEAAKLALSLKVDAIGVSSLAGAHLESIPRLIKKLDAENGEHISVVAGGVIPPGDYQALRDAGVDAIFGPGSAAPAAADSVLQTIVRHLKANRPLRSGN